MSASTCSCSERTAQTLFDTRIQDLQQQHLEQRRQLEQANTEPPVSQTEKTINLAEPFKGQQLDVFA